MEPTVERKLRVFISGSFEANKDDFNKVETMAKDMGMEVIRMDKVWDILDDLSKGFTKRDFWEVDLKFLSTCDCIIMLPNWIEHRGCCMEYGFAKSRNMMIIEL